jgi:CRISPR-associated protein Csh1
MITELINFTKVMDAEDPNFKTLGSKPKEGLHILLQLKAKQEVFEIDQDNFEYAIFSKKIKAECSVFLENCKQKHQNAWCVDTNKCFDLPTKAMHTCSPYAMAFKKEHLEHGAKFEANAKAKKLQIHDRFSNYFDKASLLQVEPKHATAFELFKLLFTQNQFSAMLDKIALTNEKERDALETKIAQLKEEAKIAISKAEKEDIKIKTANLEQDKIAFKALEDSDYVIFYLDLPLQDYKAAHKIYLDDKLFNTDKHNTKPNEAGLIYGTSNFMNAFPDKKPFLTHQTASFDISGRISNEDASLLNDFINMLPNKTLPNPLPIFIYQDELLRKMISVAKEEGKKTYTEIIKDLIGIHSTDLGNYYLLNWANSTDGIVFKDFDFVSRFDYKLDLEIQNLFGLKQKGIGEDKPSQKIHDVFELEQRVFKELLQNKYLKMDYFNDLSSDGYEQKPLTFVAYAAYRKSVYDFVYKSQKQAIGGPAFQQMVFNGILDDIKQNNSYGIKSKLNIWYSLYEYFNPNKNQPTMANNLKNYQELVDDMISLPAKEITLTDESFAFAAGQVVRYLLKKSKANDGSHRLLEPYLQQSKCLLFKQAIANDFARYKHEKYSRNFEIVLSHVLAHPTEINIKNLLPEFLSGFCINDKPFSTKS